MSSLSRSLAASAQRHQKRVKPLWDGPEAEGPNGGVTQSLLARFLVCRERFRIHCIEGLQPVRRWEPRSGFGDMWHVCEEAFAKHTNNTTGGWIYALPAYVEKIKDEYPTQQEDIVKWYNICKTQFPVYVRHWAAHPDVQARTPLMQEAVFDVPYKLPSGRVVRLRGKFDSVDLIDKHEGFPKGIWLQENKTKSKVNEIQHKRQLTFDLQTMFYLIALREWQNLDDYATPVRFPKAVKNPVLGVRYNVIRRDCPVKQHADRVLKAGFKRGETVEEWCERLRRDYFEAEPHEWFFRWKSPVGAEDVARFRRECLDPVLDELCCWYGEQTHQLGGSTCGDCPRHNHWRHPFGVYNVINEGGNDDIDEYIATGSEVGLTREGGLFNELKEE